MTIQPCNKCPFRADCDIKREKLARVRGLGLTAFKFRCKKLKDSFQPGTKVRVKLDYVAYDIGFHPEEGEWVRTRAQTVDAYVMAFDGPKVRIFVPYSEHDPEWWLQKLKGANTGDSQFVHVLRVQPDRLEAVGEIVPACKHCGMPEGFEKPEAWHCHFELQDHGYAGVESIELDCEFTGGAR